MPKLIATLILLRERPRKSVWARELVAAKAIKESPKTESRRQNPITP
ncbi:MAG: hypothetical protein WCD69_16540 [Xanthobacteraceae bacterium]